MDSIYILIAFVLGFASRQVGLPPLVGYLIAGFLLNAGVQAVHNFFAGAGAGLAEQVFEKSKVFKINR